MDIKVLFSIAATTIAVVSYVPYIRDILRGKTKPHAFSWLVWSLLAYIVGIAQLTNGGGLGSLVALTTATIALYIAFAAWTKHRQLITRSDWFYFVAALLAIPIWLLTDNPLFSIILVSAIDLAAFIPTFRKSYHLPYSETLSQSYLSTLKHILTIVAQQQYSWVTILFPLSLAITTAIFTAMLVVRRAVVSPPRD